MVLSQKSHRNTWMIHVEEVSLYSHIYLSVTNYVNTCDGETSAILFNCFVDMQIYQEPLCASVCLWIKEADSIQCVCVPPSVFSCRLVASACLYYSQYFLMAASRIPGYAPWGYCYVQTSSNQPVESYWFSTKRGKSADMKKVSVGCWLFLHVSIHLRGELQGSRDAEYPTLSYCRLSVDVQKSDIQMREVPVLTPLNVQVHLSVLTLTQG